MRNNASRTTVHHVAGAESAEPKQPHDTDIPRATTDATTTMKIANRPAATAEAAGSSQPPTRYTPNSTSNGGSATATMATRGPGNPKPKAVIVAAKSDAWPILSAPAAMNNKPSPIRTTRGTI